MAPGCSATRSAPPAEVCEGAGRDAQPARARAARAATTGRVRPITRSLGACARHLTPPRRRANMRTSTITLLPTPGSRGLLPAGADRPGAARPRPLWPVREDPADPLIGRRLAPNRKEEETRMKR